METQTRAGDFVSSEPRERRRCVELATGKAYVACRSGREIKLSADTFSISPCTYPASNSRKPSAQTKKDTAARAATTNMSVRRNLIFMSANSA